MTKSFVLQQAFCCLSASFPLFAGAFPCSLWHRSKFYDLAFSASRDPYVVPRLHSVTSTGHSRVSSQTPQAAAAPDWWVFRDTPSVSSQILLMLSHRPGMLVPQFMEILLPTLSSKGSAQKTHSP